MHLTDRCRFLNCSVRMGGWDLERYVMNSQPSSWGREVGAVRYEFIMYRSPPPSPSGTLWIQDPRLKQSDPGSKTNIPDPQH
jgi:hypothetical protein